MKQMATLALTLMMLGASLALAQDAEITVQGTAQIYADPDIVSVTASATVNAKTIAGAQEEMDRIIENVTNKLIEFGVIQTDIVTSYYGFYPTYTYNEETGASIITGYQASHTLEITCRDVEMLDGVIGVVTDCGMSEIYNVSFDTSDRSALYQQALALAIDAARAKADVMAAAGGVTIAGLESVTENGGYTGVYSVNATADTGSEYTASSGTGIRSGSVTVTASVTAVYEAQ